VLLLHAAVEINHLEHFVIENIYSAEIFWRCETEWGTTPAGLEQAGESPPLSGSFKRKML